MSSESNIPVIFRPTSIRYNVQVNENSTIREVINDVCRQAGFTQSESCFLWFNSKQLSLDNTIHQSGLYPISLSIKHLAEVRFKSVHQLLTSSHLGNHVVLASPEQIDFNEILGITLPYNSEHIKPSILKSIAEQIVFRASPYLCSLMQIGLILIPLPVYSKQTIDYLPTVYITLPSVPEESEWKKFMECLVTDLDIDLSDLVTVDIQNNPGRIKIKFTTKILQKKKNLEKMRKNLTPNALTKTRKFIDKQMISSHAQTNKEIKTEIENFTIDYNILEDNAAVTSDYIDLALRLSERSAIIDPSVYDFLKKKSREITTCLLHSFQQCPIEYVIDHIEIIYHDRYDHNHTLGNEKILFHAEHITNFENIFENFHFLSKDKRVEDGQYGRGYYFLSCPRKAVERVKSKSRSIIYLLGAIVKVGKTLIVTDSSCKNKDIQAEYDSHYVPMDDKGKPIIINDQKSVYDGYVIKGNDQILPLYLIGLRPIYRFVVWRDAKITNEENTVIFEEMNKRYDFNLYGCQSNIEVFDILNYKLHDNKMKCVVITNGDDDGEAFIRKCREFRPDIPVIVYCQNVSYHQQWAGSLGKPKIKVTDQAKAIMMFIDETFA